jgi:hypothetical protein
MFSFAALVIHSVFRSDHTPGKQHINMTSGYVDLAPLYGNDQETQYKVSSTIVECPAFYIIIAGQEQEWPRFTSPRCIRGGSSPLPSSPSLCPVGVVQQKP